jgi:hypothetical protein
MSASSKPPAPNPPGNEAWITLTHELDLPDGKDFISAPPRMPFHVTLDLCEELLAQRSVESVLSQPDRVKSAAEFQLLP